MVSVREPIGELETIENVLKNSARAQRHNSSGMLTFPLTVHVSFVVRYGWLTDQQLIDAVAIGQVTPGPVFTTATFIGYLLGGLPGALLTTLGIFLPSFFFVGISNPLIPRIRNSAWVSGLLDSVNVASLGLMAAVTWRQRSWGRSGGPVAYQHNKRSDG